MPLERAINVFALLEAETVTGPAGNLLQFHRTAFALSAAGRAPSVRLTLAVFQRGGAETRRTPLCEAAAAAGVPVVVIGERFRLDPRTVARLRELTDAARPDVVETHSVKSHLLLRLTGLPRRCAWAAFHHGYTRPDTKMTVYRPVRSGVASCGEPRGDARPRLRRRTGGPRRCDRADSRPAQCVRHRSGAGPAGRG